MTACSSGFLLNMGVSVPSPEPGEKKELFPSSYETNKQATKYFCIQTYSKITITMIITMISLPSSLSDRILVVLESFLYVLIQLYSLFFRGDHYSEFSAYHFHMFGLFFNGKCICS